MKPKDISAPKETFTESSLNVLRILHNPHTKDYKRQLHATIMKLLNNHKDKLDISDISDLTKLLLVLYEKLESSKEHLNHFLNILSLCTDKFKLLKSTDTLTMIENVRNLFNGLGFLLGSTKDPTIIEPILISLKEMIQITKNAKSFVYKGIFLEGLINSQLLEILIELLEISDGNDYHNYLKTVESLLINNKICQVFIKLNAFDIIMKKLYIPIKGTGARSSYEELSNCNLPGHVNTSKNVLFDLIDAFSKSSSIFKNEILNSQPITRVSWNCIADIFFILIANPNEQRSLRNNYFLLVRLLSREFNVDYALSYLDGYNLIFATEIIYDSWVSQVHFQPDELDFEFKVLSLSMLGINCPYEATADLLKKMKAIKGLIKIINPDVNLIWNDGQRKTLMRHALIATENIVLKVFDEFVNENGPKILLNLLRLCLQDIYPIVLVLPTLRCIRKTLNGNLKIIDCEYRKEKILSTLLKCLKDLNKLQHLSRKNQNCLVVIYCILEKLSINEEKETPEIIKNSLKFIKRYLRPLSDDFFLLPNGLIVIFDFLWKHILNHKQILDQFVSEGGIFILMDVIENFPMAIKVFGLSILTDLCEMGGLPCILTWRGKTGDSVIPFLMKIYRQQCKFDKDVYTRYIITTGHRKIINSTVSREHKTENSCFQMLGNCKPNIYAILSMINCYPEAKLVNNTYNLRDVLNYEDKVTLLLAEYYFPLKIGEIWTELNHDFQTAGIRPLLFDQQVITCKIRKYHELANFVKYEQRKLLLEEELKDKQDELLLYNRLKESILPESLEALDELKHRAFCTDSVLRLPDITTLREKMDERRNTSKDLLIRYHQTVPRAKVTFVGGQKIVVDPKIVFLDDISEHQIKSLMSSKERDLFNQVNSNTHFDLFMDYKNYE